MIKPESREIFGAEIQYFRTDPQYWPTLIQYHSLNNWHDQPDAVAALEDKAAYARFMVATLARIRELVTLPPRKATWARRTPGAPKKPA